MLLQVVMVEFEAAAILQLLNATDGEFQDIHPIEKYFPFCILSQMSARMGGLYGCRSVERLEKRKSDHRLGDFFTTQRHSGNRHFHLLSNSCLSSKINSPKG